MQNAPRTALVTGGTSGIGRSITRALAHQGVRVLFVGRNEVRGAALESELASNASARFLQADLGTMGAVRTLADTVLEQLDRLDTLVNVAGIVLPDREVTDDGFEKTLAVDHLAAFELARRLRPLLARAERGRIVNVSGPRRQVLAPQIAFDDFQLERGYSLTRAVIHGLHAKTVMTQLMAERYADDGIDVIAFDPGAVRSGLARNMRLPMRWAMRVAQWFMPEGSAAGIYASTSKDLDGVTGQLIVGRELVPLAFDAYYGQRVWDATESLVDQALAGQLRS